MSLPIRTTLSDIDAICAYLLTKPTGATMPEAKAVVDGKVLDARKITAYKQWGLIDDSSGKMRISERGRLIGKDKGAKRSQALQDVIHDVPAYKAIAERAVHRGETVLTAIEVAAHWHEHFKSAASENDKILNDQAVCFFQVAEGADLGRLVIGRKGQPTRFEFESENLRSFVEVDYESDFSQPTNEDDPIVQGETEAIDNIDKNAISTPRVSEKGNRVFITHGKNRKILEQVKEIVAFGRFEPIVAQERETAAKPVPDKVMDEMRSCQAAVIHVGVDGILNDADGNPVPQINGNVLIEIGAAMALYGRNFILLVEDGVILPSNLQGLYECRYSGDELNMNATMKLLKAFNEF